MGKTVVSKSKRKRTASAFGKSCWEAIEIFWRKHKKAVGIFLLLVAISMIFTLVFSTSTSPLYANYYESEIVDGGDSLQFLTIGKEWLEGKIPYRDLFDHKGPIIFLVNALGFWIGGGTRYGVLVFQVIALVITLCFVWKISQLVKRGFGWGLLSVLATLVCLGACYVVGNSVAGYSLAFLMPGVYGMVRYFYRGKYARHEPKWAFVYGVGIGGCVLLQGNHALPLLVGILVIGFELLRKKKWANFWQNIGAGLAGILVMCLPFAIYFAANGCFEQFLYASLGYNFEYATKIDSWLEDYWNGAFVYNFLIVFFPYVSLFLTTALALIRKKWVYGIYLVILVMAETYVLLGGAGFNQYVIPFVFQIALFLNEIALFERRGRARRVCYFFMVSLLVVVVLIDIFTLARQTVCAYEMAVEGGYQDLMRKQEAGEDMSGEDAERLTSLACRQILEQYEGRIKENTIDIYVSGLSLKNLYLMYDLEPNNRFFLVQDWHAYFSPRIREEIVEEFANNSPEYLLTDVEYVPGEDWFVIHDTVESNYRLLEARDGCKLYQRNAE